MLDHDGIERHGIKAIAKALLFLLFVGFGTGWRRCWDGWVLQNDFYYCKRRLIVLNREGVYCFK